MDSSLRAVAREIYAAMRPPPQVTLTEWAEAHRVIPPPASEPGPYRSDRVPYMCEIMTASEALLCCVGYFTNLDPCAMMMVLPTLENARQWSREKLNPLLETTRCLKGLLRPSSSRDADNTISVKRTANGALIVVVGGEAATGLISRAVKVLFIDELDHMGLSAGGEGSPVYLAEIRQSSYWDAKTYIVSTPVNLDTSEIYKRWLHSDMRRFHCPCPHCGELQHLKFDQVKWAKTDAGEHLPQTAMYACEHCGACWSDAERHQVVAKGCLDPRTCRSRRCRRLSPAGPVKPLDQSSQTGKRMAGVLSRPAYAAGFLSTPS
jgi:phage terminase large subunit GpA-like protein